MDKGAGMTARVSLDHQTRRDIALLHARRVFVEEIAPRYPQATLRQIATLLTVQKVPPVRRRGGWTEKMAHDLLQRVRNRA